MNLKNKVIHKSLAFKKAYKQVQKLSLLSLVFILNSCVVYYTTSEVRTNFQKNINQINKIHQELKSDYVKKTKIYNELSYHIINPNLDPFKNITTKKKEFDKIYQKITIKKDEIISLKNNFEKLVSGKSKIKSNEPEFVKLKVIKNEMSLKGGEINSLATQYNESSNQLGKCIKNSGFSPINKSEFINQIQNNQKSLKSSISDVEKKLNSYKATIDNSSKSNLINDSIYQLKLNILKEMSSKNELIKTASKNLILFKTEFDNKTKNQEEIWTGENTKSNVAVKKIENQINSIKTAQKEFSLLANKLNN